MPTTRQVDDDIIEDAVALSMLITISSASRSNDFPLRFLSQRNKFRLANEIVEAGILFMTYWMIVGRFPEEQSIPKQFSVMDKAFLLCAMC